MCCSGCRRVTVASGTRYAAEPVVDLEDLHAPAKRAEPRLAQDSSGVRVGLVVSQQYLLVWFGMVQAASATYNHALRML